MHRDSKAAAQDLCLPEFTPLEGQDLWLASNQENIAKGLRPIGWDSIVPATLLLRLSVLMDKVSFCGEEVQATSSCWDRPLESRLQDAGLPPTQLRGVNLASCLCDQTRGFFPSRATTWEHSLTITLTATSWAAKQRRKVSTLDLLPETVRW